MSRSHHNQQLLYDFTLGVVTDTSLQVPISVRRQNSVTWLQTALENLTLKGDAQGNLISVSQGKAAFTVSSHSSASLRPHSLGGIPF